MIDIANTGTGQVRVTITIDDGSIFSEVPDAIDCITPTEARRLSVALAVAAESARKEAPHV